MNDTDVLRAAAAIVAAHELQPGHLLGLADQLAADAARRDEPVPCTPGLHTRAEVSRALNQAARQFRQVHNPDGTETGDALAAREDADLLVNLAGVALLHPGTGLDEAIYAAYATAGLDPDFDGLGLSVWNSHANDLGDYCPWSGQQATRQNREALMSGVTDDRCPQGCQASGLEDPRRAATCTKPPSSPRSRGESHDRHAKPWPP
jgi:hypothetical protein